MASLPQVGGDAGNWGTKLNDFLLTGHNTDGTTKNSMSVINVRDFGAHSITEAGYESFDSTSAIQAAINATISGQTGGVVFLPSGTYVLGTKLTVSTAKALKIIGDGSAQTILKWTALDGGLDITYTTESLPPSVVGLSLWNTDLQNSTALKITCSPVATLSTNSGFIIDDISIRGSDETANSWDIGIHLIDCWYPKLTSIYIKGQTANSNPFASTAGVKFERVQVFTMSDFAIWHVEIAILQTGITYGEGVRLKDFEIVGVTTGIYLAAYGAPGTVISDGHINSYVYGILAENKPQLDIHDMLIYKTHNSTSDWIGIQMANCPNLNISHNDIHGSGSATGANYGMLITSTEGGIVADNQIDSFSVEAAGIILGSDTKDMVVHGNLGGYRVYPIIYAPSKFPNFIYNNYP